MNFKIKKLISFWFSLSQPVGRKDYFLSGVGLMVLKYAVDVLIVWLATGLFWNPFDYLTAGFEKPNWYHLISSLITPHHVNALTYLVLFFWMLPFLWIGLSMSLRRAVDAGLSPWISFLFFLPLVNYLLMLVLSVLPTRKRDNYLGKSIVAELHGLKLKEVFLGATGGIIFGILTTVTSVYGLKNYGTTLFVGTPFVIGVISSFLLNYREPKKISASFGVACLSLIFLTGFFLLLAIEGLICLLMALPLAVIPVFLGSIVGRAMAIKMGGRLTHAAILFFMMPVATHMESVMRSPGLREVVSPIEIDAPAERIWPYLVSFSEIPEPEESLFRLGIAYPMRARLEGKGVGAKRYCEFSTGNFVEPITRWEEPIRLSFDVAFQPKPMKELSPYLEVNAPHLEGFFSAKKGEFRLIPLGPNRTRLEGSTWYELDIHPRPYWQWISDRLVHKIHLRVLAHIKNLAENKI